MAQAGTRLRSMFCVQVFKAVKPGGTPGGKAKFRASMGLAEVQECPSTIASTTAVDPMESHIRGIELYRKFELYYA